MTEQKAASVTADNDALLAQVAARRDDTEFMQRLRSRIAEDGIPTGIDWQQVYEREATKFQAETRTTSFLAERLRAAKGAAVLCDRCKGNYGKAVLSTDDQTREWLCGRCLGEPERRERFRV